MQLLMVFISPEGQGETEGNFCGKMWWKVFC